MTTELETKIEELKAAVNTEMQTLMDRIKAYEDKNAENVLLGVVLQEIGAAENVRESAEKAGLSVENFIVEAIMTAMDERKTIPVDIEVYNRLEARASGRGLNIEQLFNRSAFQEFLLDGLQRGAF